MKRSGVRARYCIRKTIKIGKSSTPKNPNGNPKEIRVKNQIARTWNHCESNVSFSACAFMWIARHEHFCNKI